ncbi:MAG TPA: hypothetical protein PKV93_05635 [Fervidobacterium sp.]|nr:hypothetical protein [Fervidobacterium sp.]
MMQELVFWIVFSTIAAALLLTQVLSTNISKPNVEPPQEIKEALPDVSKIDKSAILVYENYVLTKKLEQISKGKRIVYGLGENSGPEFNISVVKEGAKQNALQKIMDILEEIKSGIKTKIQKEKGEKYSQAVDEIFNGMYQQLSSSEGALVNIYKIWQKNKGEVTTYYMLIIFDDEYALTFIESLFFDILSSMKLDGLDFETLWRDSFLQKVSQK